MDIVCSGCYKPLTEPVTDNVMENKMENVFNILIMSQRYSTLHADSQLSAKLRGKFKLCEETHGGHYFGHSQNSAEFCRVDKIPRRKP